jgi:type I restriction enzyme S subunit
MMVQDWNLTKLSELIETNSETYSVKEGWKYINYLDTGNITDNLIGEIIKLEKGIDKIPSRAKRKVKDGDVIFSTVRPNQRHFGMVKSQPKNFLVSTGFTTIRAKPEKASSEFIYWYLSQPTVVEFLHGVGETSASAYPSIKPSDIEELELLSPPLAEQKAIATILGSIEDKIENNRQINETLEVMAQTIFKSWFEDFDPIHAKAAGNEPAHMDAETAALFPSSFGDDDLPVGFSEKTLKDFGVELESGKRPKGGIDKSLEDGVPSVGAESLLKIGEFEDSKVKFVLEDFAGKSTKGHVQNYDVAIYKDGANVGDPKRVSLFGNGFPFNEFMVNEHVFLIRSKELGQPFLYYLCQSEVLSHQLKSMGTSKGAQPGLNQQEVLSCKFIAPTQALLSAFNKIVLPFIDRRLSLGLENKTLGKLRDFLLPKLMSGEIRLKDAERELETAL